MDRLPEFLTEFPPVIDHPTKPTFTSAKIDWALYKKSLVVDETVLPTEWAKPGTTQGLEMLKSFVKSRLKKYNDKRNDPNESALSNLSPWLHYGQLGSQRATLYVKANGSSYSQSVAAYVEESIGKKNKYNETI